MIFSLFLSLTSNSSKSLWKKANQDTLKCSFKQIWFAGSFIKEPLLKRSGTAIHVKSSHENQQCSHPLQSLLTAPLVLTRCSLIRQDEELRCTWKSGIQRHQQLFFGNPRHLQRQDNTAGRFHFTVKVKVWTSTSKLWKIKSKPSRNRRCPMMNISTSVSIQIHIRRLCRVTVIRGKLKKTKFLAWNIKHHDCCISTARRYKTVMTLKATGGWCWHQRTSQSDRDLMYLWQSCPHHTPYVLPPLGDVRIVLIKSWRERQQQRPEELWKKDEAASVWIWLLPLVLSVINLMCSFVLFHLATYALKLIALKICVRLPWHFIH